MTTTTEDSFLQEVRDWIYIPRARAIALGFKFEGTHFGVPVWCSSDGDGMEVAAKCGFLEWVIDFGASMLQFSNTFRAPDEQLQFAFRIRPIEGSR